MSTNVEMGDSNVVLTRVFDAPRELVFAAFSEADRLQSWIGCEGAKSVRVTLDLRVGGTCRTVMQVEGVGELVSVATYTEVDPPRRIAYSLAWEITHDGGAPPPTIVTIDFVERDGGTEVRLEHSGLVSDEMRMHVPHGWQASFERLVAVLAARASSS